MRAESRPLGDETRSSDCAIAAPPQPIRNAEITTRRWNSRTDTPRTTADAWFLPAVQRWCNGGFRSLGEFTLLHLRMHSSQLQRKTSLGTFGIAGRHSSPAALHSLSKIPLWGLLSGRPLFC